MGKQVADGVGSQRRDNTEAAGITDGRGRVADAIIDSSVPHTILLHHNLASALFLGDALAMFRGRGWQLVNAEQAFTDLVFLRQPLIAPAGNSLVWQLAKEQGAFEDRLRSPGEDDVYEKPEMDALGL